MEPQEIAILIVIGAVAGWLAGTLLKGGGFGLLGNIIVGIVGGVLGTWLFNVLDVSVGGEWVGPIVRATVGAVVLLLVAGMIRKKG